MPLFTEIIPTLQKPFPNNLRIREQKVDSNAYLVLGNSHLQQEDAIRKVIEGINFFPIFSKNRLKEEIVFTIIPYRTPDFFDENYAQGGALPAIDAVWNSIRGAGSHQQSLKAPIGGVVSDYWGEYLQKFYCPPTAKISAFIENESGRGKQALDLGCGIGLITRYLLNKEWETVFAVDSSPGVLSVLQSKTSDRRLRTECVDIETYSFPKNIDLIIANDLFPYIHSEKVQSVWNKVYESLAEEGYLIGTFNLPAEGSPRIHDDKVWCIDSLEATRTLLNETRYETKVCLGRWNDPKKRPNGVYFIAQKKTASHSVEG